MMQNLITKERAQELKALLVKSRRIVLTCHQNPDGDAIGSTLGFLDYLRELNKAPIIVIPDQYPDFFRWMPNVEKIIRYDKSKNLANMQIKNADLICCLDYAQYSRSADMEEALRASTAEKLVIDHHEDPQIDTPWLFSFPDLSSASEAVLRLICDMDDAKRITKRAATCLYCGMMTDTGAFTYASTRPEIYELISLLLTKGIDKDKIYRNVYHNYSFNRLRFWGYVLNQKLRYFPEKRAAYFVLTKEELAEYHYIKGDAEGLVNQPLQIKDCQLSISLREDMKLENKVWVSLRSVDDLDCIEIAAKYFNGGGHVNAAGGKLDCNIQEAEEIVRKAISEIQIAKNKN